MYKDGSSTEKCIVLITIRLVISLVMFSSLILNIFSIFEYLRVIIMHVIIVKITKHIAFSPVDNSKFCTAQHSVIQSRYVILLNVSTVTGISLLQ